MYSRGDPEARPSRKSGGPARPRRGAAAARAHAPRTAALARGVRRRRALVRGGERAGGGDRRRHDARARAAYHQHPTPRPPRRARRPVRRRRQRGWRRQTRSSASWGSARATSKRAASKRPTRPSACCRRGFETRWRRWRRASRGLQPLIAAAASAWVLRPDVLAAAIAWMKPRAATLARLIHGGGPADLRRGLDLALLARDDAAGADALSALVVTDVIADGEQAKAEVGEPHSPAAGEGTGGGVRARPQRADGDAVGRPADVVATAATHTRAGAAGRDRSAPERWRPGATGSWHTGRGSRAQRRSPRAAQRPTAARRSRTWPG